MSGIYSVPSTDSQDLGLGTHFLDVVNVMSPLQPGNRGRKCARRGNNTALSLPSSGGFLKYYGVMLPKQIMHYRSIHHLPECVVLRIII